MQLSYLLSTFSSFHFIHFFPISSNSTLPSKCVPLCSYCQYYSDLRSVFKIKSSSNTNFTVDVTPSFVLFLFCKRIFVLIFQVSSRSFEFENCLEVYKIRADHQSNNLRLNEISILIFFQFHCKINQLEIILNINTYFKIMNLKF